MSKPTFPLAKHKVTQPTRIIPNPQTLAHVNIALTPDQLTALATMLASLTTSNYRAFHSEPEYLAYLAARTRIDTPEMAVVHESRAARRG